MRDRHTGEISREARDQADKARLLSAQGHPEQSLDAYHAAINACTREGKPVPYSMHLNLANQYRAMGGANPALYNAAEIHYGEALLLLGPNQLRGEMEVLLEMNLLRLKQDWAINEEIPNDISTVIATLQRYGAYVAGLEKKRSKSPSLLRRLARHAIGDPFKALKESRLADVSEWPMPQPAAVEENTAIKTHPPSVAFIRSMVAATAAESIAPHLDEPAPADHATEHLQGWGEMGLQATPFEWGSELFRPDENSNNGHHLSD